MILFRLKKNSFIILLVFCALLSACTHTEDTSNKKVFNLNFDQGVKSLDPAFARDQMNIWCVNQLFNGLLQLSDSLIAVPAIAKSYTISPDGLQYTFVLRNDVYFHDDELFQGGKGRKVVANDFVYSFNRLIDRKVASSGAWIFNDKIKDSTAFKALNDTTFCITLTKPFPAFPSLLTAQYCSVVPHEVTEHYGKEFRNHPVGTGPFKFKYWKEGEIMIFLKNENYWEKNGNDRLPYLDAVKVSFIADKQTAFMEFIKHNIDFFNSLDGSYRNDVLTKTGKLQEKYQGKFQLIKGPYLNTEYLGMLVDSNMAIVKNSPFKYKKFRQAINYAIDRNKMVKYLRNGVGTPSAQGFIPKGMPGFDAEKIKGYSYNPEKAKKLLAELGYPGGVGLPEITLNTVNSYRDLIEFVQGELNNVGIRCKVELQPGASLRELISKNGVNFFRGSWIADYPDAENYLSVFYSKNYVPIGPNYTSFKSKKFDELFERSYYETNDSLRYKLYQQMDNLVMEESPVIILFYDQLVNMYQNNISGYTVNPLNLLNLKKIKKN
ncbi:ABC transporter substrate-binding protein [Solitalea koreensis]|uniref:Peptide/nickel transport system substrate-binding protein n=1 Tax=Solitalea koreensis TaxID=543615 RepID=A0A521AF56_9SPHI|nr:ABC transporter substrate-binding protein [Solitalea koreensis]SMO33419.1 peptide/nickel transport system substrate-binding protein [Solitalea koreensis]